MKVLLDIKDSKADFVLELLKNFSFIKTKTVSTNKSSVLEGIKESVEELKLVKTGKLKARNAEDLLNEV